MGPEHYDLIVIGSGPAGEKGAAQAAYFGKRVALIEKQAVLGGAATNTGTLPSKTLRETALFLSGFRHRQLEGLRLQRAEGAVTVRDFMARELIVRDGERARILHNLGRHGIALHTGAASFLDPHTVAVQGADGPATQLHADVILIATGSRPHRPPGYSFEDIRIYDSDEVLNLHEVPATMVVVGGGVVGCEYACVFAALGVRVTLIEKNDHLLGFLDLEIATALIARMESVGVRVLMSETVAEVRDEGPLVQVRLASGEEIETNSILVSSGRNGNVEALDLDRAGLVAGKRGLIAVDEHFQTAVPHIYAAGDVVGFPALASTAMEQARVAMVHAFQLPYDKSVARILPYGIYTIPECSMAGETEESLTQSGVPYVVGRARYADNPRGQIIGDDHGFLKLLFRADDLTLLGVHVLGEQATELVHVGLT
ncbi:MAG: Si-specific NAD(P)(+) transhydrogenase, partial [Isosphaeraceae bacterium]